jgi:hypothetical protein
MNRPAGRLKKTMKKKHLVQRVSEHTVKEDLEDFVIKNCGAGC